LLGKKAGAKNVRRSNRREKKVTPCPEGFRIEYVQQEKGGGVLHARGGWESPEFPLRGPQKKNKKGKKKKKKKKKKKPIPKFLSYHHLRRGT